MNKHRVVIFSLLSVITFDAISRGLLFPTSTALIINNASHFFSANSSLKLRDLTFEIYIAIYCFCLFFFAPLLGRLSDQYGRKKILILALCGSCFEFILSMVSVLTHSLLFLFVGRIIAGITAGSSAIAQAAMVDISSIEKKPKYLSWILLVNGFGFSLGPLIFSLIHKLNSNLVWPFALAALLLFNAILLICYFFDETFLLKRKITPITLKMNIQNLIEIFLKNNLRCYFLTYLFGCLAYTAFFGTLTVYLSESLALSNVHIGYYLMIFSAFSSVGLIIFPLISKYYDLKKIIFVVLLIQGIFSLLFTATHDLIWVLVFSLPIAIALPFLEVGITTLVSNLTDSEHQGKMMGNLTAIYALSWGVGPIFAGLLQNMQIVLPYEVEFILLIVTALFFRIYSLRSFSF